MTTRTPSPVPSAPPRMTVGIGWFLRPPFGGQRQVMRLARLARLDFMLVADHVADFTPRCVWDARLGYWWKPGTSPHEQYEAFTSLGHLAGSAGGLQLGVGVADVVRRHPIALAQAALTMSQLTKRPFILGLGAGEHCGTEPYGLDPIPHARRVEEAATFVRKAFDARGDFDFEGCYFNADRANIDLRAPAGLRPAIWIAANSPRMLETVGRQGDGWLPFDLTDPGQYERSLEDVRAAAMEAGRPSDAIVPSNFVKALIAPSEREARELLDTRFMRLFGVLSSARMWREAGASHPFGEDFGGWFEVLPERIDPAAFEEAIRIVPREVVERSVIWGSTSQVTRQLEALRDAGMRSVCIYPLGLQTQRLAFYSFWALGRIRSRLH